MKIDFENPVFELGEDVWVICGPNHIIRSSITAFQSMIFKDRKDNIIGIAKKARLSHFILDNYFKDMDNSGIIHFKYLTKDEDKARGWMKVYPVEMTEEEWLKTIGERPTFEEIKESFKNEIFEEESVLRKVN